MRVPGRDRPARRIDLRDPAARLASNELERPAHEHARAEERHRVDVSVRVRIPAAGRGGHGIERGEPVARLPADAGEVATHVDCRAADHEGTNDRVRVGVPARDHTGGGIDLDQVPARLKVGEPPARVHRGAIQGQRIDGGAGIRVPGRRGAGRGVERGDAVARLAANHGEVTARVDHGVGRRQGEGVGVGAGIPARRRAGGRVERGDPASQSTADVVEPAAHVDGRAVPGHGENRTVGVRAPGQQRQVGSDVREVGRRRACDREGATEVPAARAIGDDRVHRAVELGEPGLERAARGIERGTTARDRPHSGKEPADVEGPAVTDDGMDRPVRDPQVLVDGLGEGSGAREQRAGGGEEACGRMVRRSHPITLPQEGASCRN